MQLKSKYRGVYIRQGANGPSYLIDYVHPMTGARVRKTVPAGSERQASELREIELADARRGALNSAYGLKAASKPMTFARMTEMYLDWADDHRKNHTIDRYKAKFLLEAFAGKLLTDINPWMVEQYKSRRAKVVVKATVNRELVMGRQIYKKAAEWKEKTGYQGDNPFALVRNFKLPKQQKPGFLEPDQVTAIMQAITHPIKRAMVAYAYYTGWRISDIRRLKWDDVNLDRGVAWISDPKNANPVEVPLSDQALQVLKNQRHLGEYVFCHLNGQPYATTLHDIIKSAAARAGVKLPPRKAWHMFRRTWASMMIRSGCDVVTLQALGNWKDVTMPLWYADAARQEQQRELLNRVPTLPVPDANVTNTSQTVKSKKPSP